MEAAAGEEAFGKGEEEKASEIPERADGKGPGGDGEIRERQGGHLFRNPGHRPRGGGGEIVHERRERKADEADDEAACAEAIQKFLSENV